jgi:inhibitor of cysteine peptidase
MAEHRLTAADGNSTIHVQQGDGIVIVLPENPTTGYRWALDGRPGPAIRLDAGTYMQGEGGGVGSAGSRVFHVTVATAGSSEISLKRWREWEGETSVVERFSVTIVVDA